MVTVAISWADGADITLPLPSFETAGSAGADLRANLAEGDRKRGMLIEAKSRMLISTGFYMEIPKGYEAQIRPRSGLALKHGITLMNSVGTIDSDYRGIVGIILYNSCDKSFQVGHGDRIAQMVIAPVTRADFVLTAKLIKTGRGSGGFGSTGSS